MAKKKGKYSYDEALEGQTVWMKEPIRLNSEVTQKELEMLYKIGYVGVYRSDAEEE